VLVHRRNGFSAVASSVYNMRRAVAAVEMEFMVGSSAELEGTI
jgi:thioredoxin reductase (NADPH)